MSIEVKKEYKKKEKKEECVYFLLNPFCISLILCSRTRIVLNREK